MDRNRWNRRTAWKVIKLVLFVFLIVVLIFGCRMAYRFGYQVIAPTAAASAGTGKKVEITIKDGENVAQVAKELEKNGVIKSARMFRLQEKFSSYAGKMKSGTFTVSSEMTPEEILEVLSNAL